MASLKLYRPAAVRRQTAKFPRPKGRGLIEASLSSIVNGCRMSNFHGRKAVASLKQQEARQQVQQQPYFHGRKAVASLKPQSSEAVVWLGLTDFHGRKAVASLKRFSAAGDRAEAREDFHGRKAVASLKRRRHRCGHWLVRGFPRPKGRGLIEAAWPYDRRLCVRHISTAERPWPH